jgi:methanogenic corrinoid protein MtbC1
MRYYSTASMDESGNDIVETLSEEDIREQYYPYWYGKMCNKFGKEHVDANYCFEDCLVDWIVVHWAWEVTA